MVALRLPVAIEAARLARRAVEDVPELEPHGDLQFVAALLTTELVTNAVRHARLGPDEVLALLVEVDGELVHVEVSDPGAGFFALGHTRSVPGRRVEHGLHLVDVLADRWGFRRDHPGCCIWFDLDLVPGRRPWRGRQPVPARYF